ncbi:tetratricopeptide repeat protein [Striga asiatica]|uniref:Tetratricopeptide repeat protein n=1 Tax=Striga asiatica TaxID=4170 RepID=A0A5A7P971_STRAF|nr:tetratricopeptide repeat protein [Striga asiatica]
MEFAGTPSESRIYRHLANKSSVHFNRICWNSIRIWGRKDTWPIPSDMPGRRHTGSARAGLIWNQRGPTAAACEQHGRLGSGWSNWCNGLPAWGCDWPEVGASSKNSANGWILCLRLWRWIDLEFWVVKDGMRSVGR